MNDDRTAMTVGMKAMVMAIFVCIVGLVVGLASLLGDWPLGKSVGAASLAGLAAIFWASSGARNETLNRFLYGSRQIKR
ncbi:hypothetical protein QTL94_24615 [Rhizobium sp. S96]|nr:hypothetical protein [Rhizobium sp. S96]